MKKIINKIRVCSLAAFIALCGSCESYFMTSPDDMMPEENNYKDQTAIFSAFVGLAAVFQEVADQSVLLSELRGDMMEPTEMASADLWQIHRFEIDAKNRWVAPDAYYKMILSANDFIRHVVETKKQNPEIVADNVYKGMISQALTFRNWCYLTMGKIYGEAAWHDFSFPDKTDASSIPMLKFDDLVKELIASMLTGVDGVDGFNDLSWSDHVLNNGDYSWNRVPVKASALMAELYLWNGEYRQTIAYAMKIINEATDADKFKISTLYKDSKWATMISSAIGNAISERLTVVPFSASEKQFSQMQFLLKRSLRATPSVALRYERQERTDDGSGDRFRGKNVTYKENEDGFVINKYFINSSSADAPIIIYRAADVHFMMIESLNRLGMFEEAMAFLNSGLITYWDGKNFNPPMDNPLFPNSLQKNVGIRGRVSLKACELPVLEDANATAEQKMFAIDSLMCEEVAMESAYEGKRLFTLMRVARYWEKPEIVAIPVASKFVGEEEKYKTLLMNPENWFIHVNHTK